MDIKLQNQIFETFSWYSSVCQEKGIRCGNGWFNILDNLNFKINEYLKKHPIKDFQIRNISETLGGLKIDINIKDNVIQKYINEAISESYYICEYCGAEGVSTNISGWIITLCEECFINPPIKKLKAF